MSTVQDVLFSIPLCTCILLIVNVLVHAFVFIFTVNVGPFAISSYRVIHNYEFYRMITSAFLHGGIMHIGMNMFSLIQLGGPLEQRYGTWQFLIFSLWAVILTTSLYIALNCSLAYLTGDISWEFTPAIGYSGVLFTYATIESHVTTTESHSIFGLFSVPSKLYPWVLLIILQFMLPNVSMIGHLSGILVGLLTVSGWLHVIFPSAEFYVTLEDNCSTVRNIPSYSAASNTRNISWIIPTNATGNSTGLMSSVYWGCGIVGNILETVAHVFGCGPWCSTTLTRIRTSCQSLTSMCSVEQCFGTISNGIAALWTFMTSFRSSNSSSYMSVPQTDDGNPNANRNVSVTSADQLLPMPVETVGAGASNYGSGSVGGDPQARRYAGNGSGYHPLVGGKGTDAV